MHIGNHAIRVIGSVVGDVVETVGLHSDLHALELHFAVTTITLAEVMIGPLQSNDEALARRYRTILESWQVVELDSAIAESAARLRATLRLKLPDAVQAASALAVNADALITHDRDFSRMRSLRVIS